jgi:hypothetical protein
MPILCNMRPCILVCKYQSFAGAYCLHFQDSDRRLIFDVVQEVYFSLTALKVETIHSIETLVCMHKSRRFHTLKDENLHQNLCGNVKSCIKTIR